MGIHYICIPLLLSGIIYSKVPDFVADYDDYEVCEGDACMYKYVFLWLEKTVQVPNRSVTYAESDYFDVNIVGLLADCAPSLSLGDIATHVLQTFSRSVLSRHVQQLAHSSSTFLF